MAVVPLLLLLFRPHVPVVMVRVGQGQCAEKSGKVAEWPKSLQRGEIYNDFVDEMGL